MNRTAAQDVVGYRLDSDWNEKIEKIKPSWNSGCSTENKGLKTIMPLGVKCVGFTNSGMDPAKKPEVHPGEDPDRLVWWLIGFDDPECLSPSEPYIYLPESAYCEYIRNLALAEKKKIKKMTRKKNKKPKEEEINYGVWAYIKEDED